ncbi:MAG: FtsW/RodA/SpoVE family cell cycle protein [Abditibacteriota bacterium]|nr:FtsW/RodA/SpoVE family cell cycle protein [Abditibacteriota bacterium]
MNNKIKKNKNELKLNNDKKRLQSPESTFIVGLMILITYGLVFVFDTCYTATKSGSFRQAWMQLGFVVVGALICGWVSFWKLKTFKRLTLLIGLICLGLLIAMFFVGKEVNGATRWIDLGFFQIQPPEFAKIAFVLGLALAIDLARNFEYKIYKSGRVNHVLFVWICILLVVILCCVGLSSLSALIIFVLIALSVAYMGNFSRVALLIILGIILLAVVIQVGKGVYYYNIDNPSEAKLKEVQLSRAVLLENALAKDPLMRTDEEQFLVEDYNKKNLGIEPLKEDAIPKDKLDKIKERMSISGSKEKGKAGFRDKRVGVWINPMKYVRDIGLQTAYGLMAISSGGFFGKGLGQGMFKFNIPESHNDYIFPTIVEEGGFFWSFILLISYGALFFGSFKTLRDCKNDYGKLLCAGALVTLGAEFFINVMVALNMIPSTGVCLPFISYGGSSTIVNFILAGIIIAVSRQRDFENDEISPNEIKVIKKKYRNKTVMVPKEFDIFKGEK